MSIYFTAKLGVSASNVTVNPRCNGDATGTITVSATGGAGGYTYSVPTNLFATTIFPFIHVINICFQIDDNTYSSNNVFDDLEAGRYTCYVLDSNNCKISFTTTITENRGSKRLKFNLYVVI